jgi:hypothetical protein
MCCGLDVEAMQSGKRRINSGAAHIANAVDQNAVIAPGDGQANILDNCFDYSVQSSLPYNPPTLPDNQISIQNACCSANQMSGN